MWDLVELENENKLLKMLTDDKLLEMVLLNMNYYAYEKMTRTDSYYYHNLLGYLMMIASSRREEIVRSNH